MSFPAFLFIPLACAVIYVLGMLMLKRASEMGVGVWRATFITNWACAVIFLPWWISQGWAPVGWELYWQPVVSAVVFFVAQVIMFLAVTRGDVSVATPVMGLKVISVALFSTLLLTEGVSWQWWCGAGLSTAAVGLLNIGGASKHRRVGQTILLAATSSVLYALCDVLLQKWAPTWGTGNFFPPMYLCVGLYSIVLLRLARGGLSGITPKAWAWLLPGAFLNAFNNAGIALTLGIWGQATAVNIVYSSRGMFGVLLVWVVGHWFANTERQAGKSALLARLVGSLAMLVAIALVLI